MLQITFETAQTRLASALNSEAKSATIIASSILVCVSPQWRDKQASLRQRVEPDRRRPRLWRAASRGGAAQAQRGSEPPRMTGGGG